MGIRFFPDEQSLLIQEYTVLALRGLLMMFDVLCMICVDLMIPVVLILAGYHLSVHTPDRGKGFFTYKSRRAKTNDDTWQFSNRYFGRWMMVEGIILSAIAIVMAMAGMDLETDMIRLVTVLVLVGEICAMLAVIIPTEAALKNTFDENGYRR